MNPWKIVAVIAVIALAAALVSASIMALIILKPVNPNEPLAPSATGTSTNPNLSNNPSPPQTTTPTQPTTTPQPLNTSDSDGSLTWNFYSIQTTSINEAISAMHDIPNNAKVFSSNDTIVFSGTQNVTILAFGMMPDDATNLTGMNPPSYASDDVFVIYGLIDPTLIIPNGAHVNLIFANLDDDMYHNFVVTSLAPPYYYIPMQGMMFSDGGSWYAGGGMMGGGISSNPTFGTNMPLLSPTDDSLGTAYYYAYTFNLSSYSGNYWYICTYPGHAQGGMYGRILVSG